MNDLLFVNRLLVPEDTPLISGELLNGETLYLVRSGSSHIWEALELIRAADRDKRIRPFLDGLVADAQTHLELLRRIIDPPKGDTLARNVKRTLKRTRNKTWHYYSKLGDTLLDQVLKRLGPFRGVLVALEKMPSLRALFADDAMFVVLTEWTRDDETFGEFLRVLSSLMVAVIHLAQHVLDAHIGGSGVQTRHYAPGVEIRKDEIELFGWPDPPISEGLAGHPKGSADASDGPEANAE